MVQAPRKLSVLTAKCYHRSDQSQCDICPPTTFADLLSDGDEDISPQCNYCGFGYDSPAGSSGSGSCRKVTCDPGFTLDQYGSGCDFCPRDTYNTDGGQCRECDPDYTAEPGSTECQPPLLCDPGYGLFAYQGQSDPQCGRCSEGFASVGGHIGCSVCPLGQQPNR